jgi:hypothetical protein
MTNPANEKETRVLPEGYRPLSQPSMKLEVPHKKGYHRRWFNGTASRIARAHQAGWTFVDKDEAEVNNFDVGGDAKTDGNTDMGTRVSIISGEDRDKSGQPARMYLMEIPDWLYKRGRQYQQEQNEGIARALREGSVGDVGEDSDTKHKYVNKKLSKLNLFTPTHSGDDDG